MKGFLATLLLFLLAGCMAPGSAPIGDIARPKSPASSKQVGKPSAETPFRGIPQAPIRSDEVVVQKGDTLFAIAFQNGLDYRDLAAWNNLASPDVIQVGQILRLTPPIAGMAKPVEVETHAIREVSSPQLKIIKDPPLVTEPKAQRLPYSEANWAMMTSQSSNASKAGEKPVTGTIAPAVSDGPATADEWGWPAEGMLIGRYGEGGGKGINIAGEKQSPVFSANAGKVVYSGSGLRGYGKMVIVKHPGEFLTAYAHNHAVLVKEGEWVKTGQKIAEMGDTDSDRVKLHFEVRQFGKPVDPLKILPERK